MKTWLITLAIGVTATVSMPSAMAAPQLMSALRELSK